MVSRYTTREKWKVLQHQKNKDFFLTHETNSGKWEQRMLRNDHLYKIHEFLTCGFSVVAEQAMCQRK